MQSTDLKALLDDYQTVTGSQVVLVIEACYSGSHLPILAAPNRAIITSAKADEQAYFDGKQGFTRFFTKYLSATNFKESYELAQRDQNELLGKVDQRPVTADATETAKTTQSAQLDDTGDGIYDPAQDGQWLKQVRINGDLQMADFTLAVENLTPAWPAVIAQSQSRHRSRRREIGVGRDPSTTHEPRH
ncbi:MAG: hypothetical protein BWK79_18835 [Beggiatoa sp. IS2]|nr:MAG: hypothetical protein BWK79_18835 [Beggiatoa sp. IS2]